MPNDPGYSHLPSKHPLQNGAPMPRNTWNWLHFAADSFIVAAIAVLLAGGYMLSQQLRDQCSLPTIALYMVSVLIAIILVLSSRLYLKYKWPEWGIGMPLLGLLNPSGRLARRLRFWLAKRPMASLREGQRAALMGSILSMCALVIPICAQFALCSQDDTNATFPGSSIANYELWGGRASDAFSTGVVLMGAAAFCGIAGLLVCRSIWVCLRVTHNAPGYPANQYPPGATPPSWPRSIPVSTASAAQPWHISAAQAQLTTSGPMPVKAQPGPRHRRHRASSPLIGVRRPR